MFFNKDEAEIRKVVSFYSMYNCVFFPLLILALFWTNSIYSAGNYKFTSVIAFILLSEVVKYVTSSFYVKSRDVNLGKKYGERTVGSIIQTVFAWTKFKDGFKNLIVTSLLMAVYFITSILYGAEVFSKHEETLMFSSLLAVLTIFPTCVNLGSHSVVSLLLGSKPINKLESSLYQNLYFTLLGAWLGAFVIPLDWDRPWQAWPIPCSIGALIGYTLSHFVTLFQLTFSSKKKNKKSYLFQK